MLWYIVYSGYISDELMIHACLYSYLVAGYLLASVAHVLRQFRPALLFAGLFVVLGQIAQ